MKHSHTFRELARPLERSTIMSTFDHNFPASREADAVFPSRQTEAEPTFLPGGCPAMRSVEQVMRELATGDAPVLIRAEAGAGKRTAAARIHQMSIRRSQPFVALDCATLTVEMLASTVSSSIRRGTVLLEEVASLTPACQTKLMDVLENGKSLENGTGRARLVFTTALDLEGELAARRFREDLYYRISSVCLRLPPLRQRREEIPQLVGFYLARYAAELGRRIPKMSAEAERRLKD